MGQCQRDRAAVKFEHNVRQHVPPVRFRFERRDLLVAITIDQRDDAVCNSRPWSQIDFQRHTRARQRHARGLKILVETMGGRRRRQREENACRRDAGSSHLRVILAA